MDLEPTTGEDEPLEADCPMFPRWAFFLAARSASSVVRKFSCLACGAAREGSGRRRWPGG